MFACSFVEWLSDRHINEGAQSRTRCGPKVWRLLLHSPEGRRAFVCSSVSPSIKWEEARLPPQKLPVTGSSSARDPLFPLPVSLWHSSEWWPAVAMVTQLRVTLLRNNDNWRQQGSSATVVISLQGVPCLGRAKQKEEGGV